MVSNKNVFAGIVLKTNPHLLDDPPDLRNGTREQAVNLQVCANLSRTLGGGLGVIADQARGDHDRTVGQGKLKCRVFRGQDYVARIEQVQTRGQQFVGEKSVGFCG